MNDKTSLYCVSIAAELPAAAVVVADYDLCKLTGAASGFLQVLLTQERPKQLGADALYYSIGRAVSTLAASDNPAVCRFEEAHRKLLDKAEAQLNGRAVH